MAHIRRNVTIRLLCKLFSVSSEPITFPLYNVYVCMYVCIYMCMYVHTYIHTYTHTHVHTHTYTHTHTHTHTYIHTYTLTYVYNAHMHTHIHTYIVCMYVRMSVCIYIPYCLKLRPVSYKCRVSISGLGIVRYNIIKQIM